jgi:hypothetical protein
MTFLKWLGDWIYGFYISFFPVPEESDNEKKKEDNG